MVTLARMLIASLLISGTKHSRLARAFRQKDQARAKAFQQRLFRGDHQRFCKSLFEKKVSGEPEFTEKTAFEYFSNLYRDDKRADPVSALPEMKSPSAPLNVFSDAPP